MNSLPELIEFFPEHYQIYWPGLDTKAGYPKVNVRVRYLDNGCMIFHSLELERRELLLLDKDKLNKLTEEISLFIANYNTIEL